MPLKHQTMKFPSYNLAEFLTVYSMWRMSIVISLKFSIVCLGISMGSYSNKDHIFKIIWYHMLRTKSYFILHATNYELHRINTICYDVHRMNTRCYETFCINATCCELSRIDTTSYEASCRNIVGHRRVEQLFQLVALRRQVARLVFTHLGYRLSGIDNCNLPPSSCKLHLWHSTN